VSFTAVFITAYTLAPYFLKMNVNMFYGSYSNYELASKGGTDEQERIWKESVVA
jgi:hypothetical protein